MKNYIEIDATKQVGKQGGIIPLVPRRLHAPKNGEILPLEIRHYGKAEGKLFSPMA
jgi:hypothetical protein